MSDSLGGCRNKTFGIDFFLLTEKDDAMCRETITPSGDYLLMQTKRHKGYINLDLPDHLWISEYNHQSLCTNVLKVSI